MHIVRNLKRVVTKKLKYYEELLEMGCFNRAELVKLTGTVAAAKSLIYDYQKKGYIERIKRDLYVAISLETKQPVMNRYEIGCRLFPDACISHHSAFEVYGYGNQVFYECYVATDSRFLDFEYDGITFHRVEKHKKAEVVQIGNVKTTSLEWTIIESIRDFEKIAGLEEVMRCMMLVPGLNEQELLSCLKEYNNGFLYQKCGFLFEQMNDDLRLSESFFEECQKHCSGARRYLLNGNTTNVWNEKWNLYTPKAIKSILHKGVSDYDAI